MKNWKWIGNFSFLFSAKTILVSQLSKVNCRWSSPKYCNFSQIAIFKDFSPLFPALCVFIQSRVTRVSCLIYTRYPSLTNTTVDITREHYRNTMIEEFWYRVCAFVWSFNDYLRGVIGFAQQFFKSNSCVVGMYICKYLYQVYFTNVKSEFEKL